MHALRSADPRGVFAADNRFHQVFVARADNAQVDGVLAHLTPAVDRLERLAIRVLPAGRSVAQHQAIIERAAAGNAAGAGTAVRANWLTLSALVEQSLGEPGTAPAAGGADRHAEAGADGRPLERLKVDPAHLEHRLGDALARLGVGLA